MIINKKLAKVLFSVSLFLVLIGAVFCLEPTGPTITNQYVEEATPISATNVSTIGGSITTMVINATTQNPHWKAFVGNVTGSLTLQDARNYSIYNWELTTPSGEVYVSRNNSINWTTIRCANSTNIISEETTMNFTQNQDDSITRTFSKSLHSPFFTGTTTFNRNQCNYTTNTYVNNTNQSTSFEEILLYDGQNIVYTTLIENNVYGFDYSLYDFQMIIPERGWDGPVTSTPYYFYVELI